MKVKINVEIPEGYEFVRMGRPKRGEEYITFGENGNIHIWTYDHPGCADIIRIIIKRKTTEKEETIFAIREVINNLKNPLFEVYSYSVSYLPAYLPNDEIGENTIISILTRKVSS